MNSRSSQRLPCPQPSELLLGRHYCYILLNLLTLWCISPELHLLSKVFLEDPDTELRLAVIVVYLTAVATSLVDESVAPVVARRLKANLWQGSRVKH